jgi:thymidylate synthase (FAD)
LMGDDTRICETARLSTGSRRGTVEENAKLINYLIKQKHTSPFEFCEAVLDIVVPIFVARQWARHRTAHFQEASARYAEMGTRFYGFGAEFRNQSENNLQASSQPVARELQKQCQDIVINAAGAAVSAYRKLMTSNVAREQARMVMPLNSYTKIRWKIDLHNLLHFLRLRMDREHAQPEIADYAEVIFHNIVVPWVPLTAAAFKDNVIEAVTLSGEERARFASWLSRLPIPEREQAFKLLHKVIGEENMGLLKPK